MVSYVYLDARYPADDGIYIWISEIRKFTKKQRIVLKRKEIEDVEQQSQ